MTSRPATLVAAMMALLLVGAIDAAGAMTTPTPTARRAVEPNSDGYAFASRDAGVHPSGSVRVIAAATGDRRPLARERFSLRLPKLR